MKIRKFISINHIRFAKPVKLLVRTCCDCELEKDISEFYKMCNYKGIQKYQHRCKLCNVKNTRKYEKIKGIEYKRLLGNKAMKKATDNLVDSYILSILQSKAKDKISYNDLKAYPEIIELQREITKCKRSLKQ